MYRFGPMPKLLLSPLVLLLLFTPKLLKLLLLAGELPPIPCKDVDMAALCIGPAPPPPPLPSKDPAGEWLCNDDCELLAGADDKFEAMACGCRP